MNRTHVSSEYLYVWNELFFSGVSRVSWFSSLSRFAPPMIADEADYGTHETTRKERCKRRTEFVCSLVYLVGKNVRTHREYGITWNKKKTFFKRTTMHD